MLKAENLPKALKGIELALIISSSNEQMIETQCSFIDACKKAVVPHLIKFSRDESQVGFDANKFRFTKEHDQIEIYLKNSGLRWTILRPSQFM